MENLTDKILDLLQHAFPESTVIVDYPESPDSKIWGTVDWKGFEEIDHLERQQRIWAELKKSLTREELDRVSTIFGISPSELATANDAND